MSKTLRLELPDELYEVLQRQASLMDKTPDQLVVEWLARSGPKPRQRLGNEGRAAALERLRRHAGVVASGDPQSADNEVIDADLARESAGSPGSSPGESA